MKIGGKEAIQKFMRKLSSILKKNMGNIGLIARNENLQSDNTFSYTYSHL